MRKRVAFNRGRRFREVGHLFEAILYKSRSCFETTRGKYLFHSNTCYILNNKLTVVYTIFMCAARRANQTVWPEMRVRRVTWCWCLLRHPVMFLYCGTRKALWSFFAINVRKYFSILGGSDSFSRWFSFLS